MTENDSPPSDTSEPAGSRLAPTQFRILDLFTAITLAAIAFAILLPILRRISGEQLLMGIAALGVQLVSAIATFTALMVRRKRMMERTGPRIGVAFSGEIAWKHWPIIRCWLTLAIAGLMQFALSLVFVYEAQSLFSPIFLIYTLQLGYFFGASISRLHWRSYPGVIEFFERGITLDGRTLTPWKRVAVRDSKIYADRIVLVSDATNISGAKATHTAQVTGPLRKQIFQFAAQG